VITPDIGDKESKAHRLSCGAAALAGFAIAVIGVSVLAHGRIPESDPPMQFDYHQRTIFADGTIDTGAAYRFINFVKGKHVPSHSWVAFNSPGGSTVAAMEMGRAIRNLGFTTLVARGELDSPGVCYSACTLAFLGGRFRMMMTSGSVYGVHRFYWYSRTDQDSDIAQIMSAEVVQYIQDMGVDPRLFGEMAAADKDNHVRPIPESELERLNVVHQADSSTWRIENRNGLFILGGTRETMSGLNRLGFFCIGNAPALFVSFEGRTAASHLQNNHDYQLEIDDVGHGVRAQPRFYPETGMMVFTLVLDSTTLSLIRNARRVGFRAAPTGGFSDMDFSDGARLFPELMAICRGMVSR
jgi:hypothetical protein